MELWKPVQDGQREVPPGGVCPSCRSPRVHRSRVRSPVERAVRAILPYRPFTCSTCKWRGWVWPEASQGIVHQLPPLPDRRHRRARTDSGKKVASPRELQMQRLRRQLVLAAILAVLTGGAVHMCQIEADPEDAENAQ